MSRGKFFGILILSATLAGAGDKAKPPAKTVPDFEVEGIGFTMCQCPAYACPCRSNAHPTHHQCEAADFAYIKRGHFGNVKLDGLKAVAVGDLINPDHSKTYATVYFDQSTTPEQRAAYSQMLQFMFSEGFPATVGPAKVVRIEFNESADKTEYTVNIPGILEEKAVLKRDESGQPAHTVPAMDQWGNAISYADNVVFKYHDAELGREWDLSGRQSNIKHFHTTKKMYDKKQLLAQHGDPAVGGWTEKQKEMIKKMGMKPE
jgi:hypothetical protein